MPAGHPLDRPVWSALTGARQAALARGDGRALRYDPDHALFAAARDDDPDSVAALGRLVPARGVVGLVEARPRPLPKGVPVRAADCVQMTCQSLTAGGPDLAFEDLAEADAAEMLALAALTAPGPFFSKTHRLGGFVGLRIGGRLAAMAGERMKPDGFTEVSGVCTHPDWRGRGYAAGLMRVVTSRILARGETAFLHAYAANTGATALYRTLGFALRSPIIFTILGDEGGGDGRVHGHG